MKTSPKNPRDAGEEMNVRKVHGALWRETAEPSEQWRRVPWLVKHFFLLLVIFGVIYLLTQIYDWKEYEDNPVLRFHRERHLRAPQPPEQAPAEPPAQPPAPPPAPPPTPTAPEALQP